MDEGARVLHPRMRMRMRSPALWLALVVLSIISSWPSDLEAQTLEQALAPLRDHGCVGCHSLDGAQSQGPTFRGLYGSTRAVHRDGERVAVEFDEAFLRRSVEEPDAEIADGFEPGFMPRFELSDTELDAVIAALASVPVDGPGDTRTWIPLALGLVIFVLGHLALSSAPMRGPLVASLGGEGRFSVLYSIVAAIGLGLLVWGYGLAPYVPLYDPPPWTRWVPNLIVPLAYVLLVMGFTTPSPTTAGMADRASAGPRGVQRITRHPALWGFALWALSHLGPNGDLRSSLVFLGIAFLAFAGMVHIDMRRGAAPNEAWTRYERETSIMPFVAILGGRQKLVLSELGWWRIALGLLAWAAMLHLHRFVFGVSPLP